LVDGDCGQPSVKSGLLATTRRMQGRMTPPLLCSIKMQYLHVLCCNATVFVHVRSSETTELWICWGTCQVSLVIPWLTEKDQLLLYPQGLVFEGPKEQEEHIRSWLLRRCGFSPSINIQWCAHTAAGCSPLLSPPPSPWSILVACLEQQLSSCQLSISRVPCLSASLSRANTHFRPEAT
jgi:hypothetical protein